MREIDSTYVHDAFCPTDISKAFILEASSSDNRTTSRVSINVQLHNEIGLESTINTIKNVHSSL